MRGNLVKRKGRDSSLDGFDNAENIVADSRISIESWNGIGIYEGGDPLRGDRERIRSLFTYLLQRWKRIELRLRPILSPRFTQALI